MSNFADRLVEAIRTKNSRVVVGLDPRFELLPAEFRCRPPAEAYREFGFQVIEAVRGVAVAVKPQVAFFEELGPEGWRVYEEVCRRAQEAGLVVICDVKRGDIADTAEAYARLYLERFPCDAITLNPYLGTDSVKPFLDRCARTGRGLFVLVKTSNPSSADFQDLRVEGEPLYLRVARAVAKWGEGLRGRSGYSSVGMVVGATHPAQAAEIRKQVPGVFFLVPGYGAQGGKAEDVRVCFEQGLGAIVNASRSVIYAFAGSPEACWQEAVAGAARRMRDEINRWL